ncbi:uncharacterized protein LOC113316331 [Papaver somniferum]|uniref:uncharacterized protein LOC113316331 n=1 Tax=Papaver somniferum TaxID=3469 RepID=UPI000E6F5840|nr:uncharacterized protein LOC113316331 [Papaver somniferum]
MTTFGILAARNGKIIVAHSSHEARSLAQKARRQKEKQEKAQKEPLEEGVLPTSLLQQPRKNPSAASLAQKKRRGREKQEKEQIARSVIPTTLIQPEALCCNEGRNQFFTDRARARMSLSQRQRRSRELNQHLSKPRGAPLGQAEKEPSRMNTVVMGSNKRIGSLRTPSTSDENEMSIPAPDISSDEYTDYEYSSDEEVDDEYENVLKAVGNIPAVNFNETGRNYLGKMDVPCSFCGALHWIDEKLTESSFKNPKFGKCCHKGKFNLPALCTPPDSLRELFEGDDDKSKTFRENIRSLNTANAFTSLGCKYDTRVSKEGGPPCFSIHGELRHNSGSLTPKEGEDAIYSQLYIYDPSHALAIREKRNPNLSREVLKIIQDTLLEHNIFITKFRQAHDILRDNEVSSQNPVQVSLHFNENSDKRRYNMPTAEEVSVIVPEKPSDIKAPCDILLHLKAGKGFTRINECHPTYLPLHYVLLFPYGELGWSTELAQWDGKDFTKINLSQMQFYSYYLFQRHSEYSTILRGGKLFQEFLVDAWASTEQNRLNFLRFNQIKLRADQYALIIKMKDAGLTPKEGGSPCILPSSYIGSPRNMYEIY